MLYVVFDLFEEKLEKVAIFVTFSQNAVVFRWNFLEMSDVDIVEYLFHLFAVDCSQVVREDEVCALETDIFHYFQELFKELLWFDLSFVYFGTNRDEPGVVFIA